MTHSACCRRGIGTRAVADKLGRGGNARGAGEGVSRDGSDTVQLTISSVANLNRDGLSVIPKSSTLEFLVALLPGFCIWSEGVC